MDKKNLVIVFEVVTFLTLLKSLQQKVIKKYNHQTSTASHSSLLHPQCWAFWIEHTICMHIYTYLLNTWIRPIHETQIIKSNINFS